MRFSGVLLGILLVLGFAGFIILSNLHKGEVLTASQKEKALMNLLGRAPITTPVDHSTWKTYESQFVSFEYPSWATIYKKDNTDAKKLSNILDSFHFGLLDQHIEGVVQVTDRPGFSQVTDEPAVTFRQQNKDYQAIGTSSGNMIEFVKATDEEERSLFVLKNGRIFSFVITGGSDSDNQEIFEKMRTSFSFSQK